MAKKKVKVVEHTGDEQITEVTNFNAQELYQQIKAAQNHATGDYVVVIGDIVIDARSVKKVVPVSEM
jgi:hypothetical protein